jgi:hypothetical protein
VRRVREGGGSAKMSWARKTLMASRNVGRLRKTFPLRGDGCVATWSRRVEMLFKMEMVTELVVAWLAQMWFERERVCVCGGRASARATCSREVAILARSRMKTWKRGKQKIIDGNVSDFRSF